MSHDEKQNNRSNLSLPTLNYASSRRSEWHRIVRVSSDPDRHSKDSMVTTIPSRQRCAKLITDSADLHPPGDSLGGFCVSNPTKLGFPIESCSNFFLRLVSKLSLLTPRRSTILLRDETCDRIHAACPGARMPRAHLNDGTFVRFLGLLDELFEGLDKRNLAELEALKKSLLHRALTREL